MKNQQKTPPLEDDTSDFPCDIIQNILSRLPVKSLLRFRAVCRSWKATIDDSGFARIHSNQLKSSDSHCFYAAVSGSFGTYSLIKFQGLEFHKESVVRFPLEEPSPPFLCCCEGILVFPRYFRATSELKFVLWNPFTRKYLTLPSHHDINTSPRSLGGCGLCFDKYEDDYKFIVGLESRYLIYSIKNDSWAERQTEFRGYVNARGVYADGIVYWIMSLAGSSCDRIIIYFDRKDNLLKKLHKPGDLEYQDRLFRLANLRGNLCFYTIDPGKIEIWLLKESGGRKSWMKLRTADNRELPKAWEIDPTFVIPGPMYLTSNNEVVFQYHNGKHYAVYCPKKQKFGEVKEFPACTEMIDFTCLESLNFPATRRE